MLLLQTLAQTLPLPLLQALAQLLVLALAWYSGKAGDLLGKREAVFEVMAMILV